MRQQTRGSNSVSPTFESRTPGEIVAVSLVMMAVTVAVVAVISQPLLIVGFAAVAVAVRMRHLVTAPTAERTPEESSTVEQPHPTAD